MELRPIQYTFTQTYSYGLYFTERMFETENLSLVNIVKSDSENAKKVLFVADSGVLKAHHTLETDIRSYCNKHQDILELTQLIELPGGEVVKNDPRFIDQLLKAIDVNKICRHSYVLAIGGGALIDLAGYAASIAHRGVRLIRIPTTVLSQNDAAVGVKNGMNMLGKKNFVGSFDIPHAVIIDHHFLTSLERRDWIAGIAEAVKVALIKDADFYQFIADHVADLKKRDKEAMQYLIYRCAELHMEHIAKGGDPFEKGSSRPLDFGHWSAHKLEHMTDYHIRHGEAVAKGMALDLVYASKIGLISEELADNIIALLINIGFDLEIPVKTDKQRKELLAGIEEFREHLGGRLTITLITSIGQKKDVHEIDRKKMNDSISGLNKRIKEKTA
ncbi:MAG: 3-dehydroquinate synthase [Flavobacteriaceae bacterium]